MTLYEEVRAALRETQFRPKKSLGQNFLIHERVIDSILRLLDLVSDDRVLEIGPGLGFLTRCLLARAASVCAVEVDTALIERLRASDFAHNPKLNLIVGDILAISPELLPDGKLKLVGNLPYSISTPVLFRIFDWRAHFSRLVLMVQKEVADRIAATPGTKDYGTLSIWSQAYGRITEKVSVSPEAFFPRPKVRSTVLKIELFDEPLIGANETPALRHLIRAAFGQRRKTLSNALASAARRSRGDIEKFLESQNIDPQRRGETLSVEEYVGLARAAHRQSLLTIDN
ncbi:MAG: 16S rRNA (adenine(1518)-N(6)/adenine(1519)-N(6))-dimethyltransferase RsmA [Candidatus Binatia bacterium]